MIVSNRHPFIAKEGWLFIGVSLCLTLASLYFQTILSIPFVLFTSFLFYIFRDPARVIPSAPLGIVSPMDGKIISIERVENTQFDRSFQKIIMQNNRLGVFAIRCPIEGKLVKQFHEKKSRDLRYISWIQTDEGDDILWEVSVRTRTKAYCYVQPGERIGHGQRVGFLALNNQMNVYVPLNSAMNVNVGDRVLAGESILAHLIHNQGASIVSEPELPIEAAQVK